MYKNNAWFVSHSITFACICGTIRVIYGDKNIFIVIDIAICVICQLSDVWFSGFVISIST